MVAEVSVSWVICFEDQVTLNDSVDEDNANEGRWNISSGSSPNIKIYRLKSRCKLDFYLVTMPEQGGVGPNIINQGSSTPGLIKP
jgi:hypothetical protein